MPHVTSTLTAAQEYTLWKETVPGNISPIKSVRIEGGTNCPNKNFITPEGVVTQITEEEAEILEMIPAFKQHQERGFVKIHRRAKMDNDGLEKEDLSAPLTKTKARRKKLAEPMEDK